MRKKNTKTKIINVLCGAHEIKIAEDDYERVKDYCGGNSIIVRELHTKNVRYAYIKKAGKYYLVARIIKRIAHGGSRRIAYMDGNPLNLTRENLIVAGQADITRKSRKMKGALSKYKGVTFNKLSGKWKAQINPGGGRKNMHLGYFTDEKDAAIEYNRAAMSFFGEFALLNKVKAKRKCQTNHPVEKAVNGASLK